MYFTPAQKDGKVFVEQNVELLVDSAQQFSFNLFTPHDDVIEILLTDPSGKVVLNLQQYPLIEL